MKRREVIDRLRVAAKKNGLAFWTGELTGHSEIRVGSTSHTLKRKTEIDETTVKKFFKQFNNELGEKWWMR
ncbi:MAG: hypothetical protein LBJ43_00910 [Propionibacteriaceae bacterium]|jgi:hypothetical protein|nr:hypothetical protein [Propionibacteriaceae bacterium]